MEAARAAMFTPSPPALRAAGRGGAAGEQPEVFAQVLEAQGERHLKAAENQARLHTIQPSQPEMLAGTLQSSKEQVVTLKFRLSRCYRWFTDFRKLNTDINTDSE